MITLDHYIRLFLYFTGIKLGDKRELSINNVSEILYCTARNSKFILKKLEDQQWIEWVPGRGRGHRSSIAFLIEPSGLVLDHAKASVKKGNHREARKLIEEYAVHFPFLTHQFEGWLNSLFGFHVENQDTLRLKLGKLPIAPLDPNKITLRSECHIVKHVCDTLVRFNHVTNQIEPHLAFFWESLNQKVWTFYLRKGVRFHDGHPLTSEDVVYTFKHNCESLYSWMIENIYDVRSIDDYTVEFILKSPNHFFLDMLCDEHLSILSHENKNDDKENMIIGTGPFKIIRNDQNMLVLEAFEHYFRERPYLDRIEFWYVPDSESETSQAAFEQNELWFGMYPTINRNDSRDEHTSLEWNVQFLSLNLAKDGPMTDPLFRQVFKEIINSPTLVQELGGGRGQVAIGFLPDHSGTRILRKENVVEIKEKSQYYGETIHLYTFDDWDHIEDANWIKARCELFGISLKPTFLSEKDLLRKDIMREADIIHDSATMNEQVEVSFLHLLLADNSFIKNHLPMKTISEIKGKVDLFYQESQRVKRFEILKGMQQTLLNLDAVIPLYRNETHVNYDRMVQNVNVNTQGWIDFTHIWFNKHKPNRS